MKKKIVLGFLLLFCVLATTASAATIGYKFEISDNVDKKNVPTMTLENTSDTAEILNFSLTIGNTSFLYDFVETVVSPVGLGYATKMEIGLRGTAINDGKGPEFIDFDFQNFSPLKKFLFTVDVDLASDKHSLAIYDTVLFNNGSFDNAVVSVGFSNGQTLSGSLPDVANSIKYTFAQTSSVPIPATAWLLGSGIVGLVGVRRKIK